MILMFWVKIGKKNQTWHLEEYWNIRKNIFYFCTNLDNLRSLQEICDCFGVIQIKEIQTSTLAAILSPNTHKKFTKLAQIVWQGQLFIWKK